ncbi:MAG: CPBP family intramembrane metalloprotease [Candidatus Diapherotrites archaeon]|nr:CPBP family intramembrane metalloprotease [Candidatus Diapherotrites archaeon]
MLYGVPFLFLFFQQKQKLEIESFKQNAETLGFKKIEFKKLAQQTGQLIVLLLIVNFALAFVFSLLNLNDLDKVVQTINQIKETSPMLLVYLLTIRVIGEEIFFRGFLVPRSGILFSTIFFALGHIGFGSITEVVGAFILGGILAYWFQKYQNLYVNISAHLFYNFFLISLLNGV